MNSTLVSAAAIAAAPLGVPAVSQPDAGVALVAAASLLLADLERGRAIDAPALRANGPARQWRMANYFPSAASRLYIARQNSRPPPSSASLRPLPLRSAVQVRSARRLSSP
jgi:hypothetical protein